MHQNALFWNDKKFLGRAGPYPCGKGTAPSQTPPHRRLDSCAFGARLPTAFLTNRTLRTGLAGQDGNSAAVWSQRTDMSRAWAQVVGAQLPEWTMGVRGLQMLRGAVWKEHSIARNLNAVCIEFGDT